MVSPFKLKSDKQFIQADGFGCFSGIHVHEYEGDLQNVSDTIHGSRWKHAHSISSGSSHTLEVHGIKFTVLTYPFARLTSDLTLTGKDGSRTIELMVNRNGVCFVNVSEDEWVRANDCLFSWVKHGVKVPEPRGGVIWNALGMVNGAVSDELLSLLEKETESFLKRSLVEKEKEAARRKTLLEETEEEVSSIKAALKTLVNK